MRMLSIRNRCFCGLGWCPHVHEFCCLILWRILYKHWWSIVTFKLTCHWVPIYHIYWKHLFTTQLIQLGVWWYMTLFLIWMISLGSDSFWLCSVMKSYSNPFLPQFFLEQIDNWGMRNTCAPLICVIIRSTSEAFIHNWSDCYNSKLSAEAQDNNHNSCHCHIFVDTVSTK